VATDHCGVPPEGVRRFALGLAHWVYDVRLPDGSGLVVRLTTPEQRADFLGAVHWSKTLRPLGVPLPSLHAHGEVRGLPYLVLERLDGKDLALVYYELTATQRRGVAEDVCRAQRLAATLPQARGYGVVNLPAGPYLPSWTAVLEDTLVLSRSRIEAAGLMSTHVVERVQEHATRFHRYLARVRPTPFLDDTTIKNVLVHRGRMSGIVDVDEICFGDPLFTIGQTRVALVNAGLDGAYADDWCDALNLTSEQRAVVGLYTAIFCVVFLSELGVPFNREAIEVDPARRARLERLLDDVTTG